MWVWPVLVTVDVCCESECLVAGPVLSWSRHLTQWTSQWEPEWEQAARALARRVTDTADHKHDRNTGTRHSPASGLGLRWASWRDPELVTSLGWWGPPGADQAPMCAQVCANQMLADTAPGPSLPLRRCKQPFLGHISQHQRDSSGVWHFYARPWCQCSFVINAQLTLAALVWMKSCLDPPDPGPSHCLLYPANMIIYTGPCQDHGVEENTISVPAMMARQLAAKQGSDAGFESLKSHRGVDCKRLRGVVWGIPWDLIQASSANKYPAFDSELRPHLSWRQLMRPARPGTSVNLYRVRHIINLSFL